MSELRALTEALRAFDKRISGVEECLLVLVRDSQQQAEWRHTQKNRVMLEDAAQRENELALKQVQDECGAIHGTLAEMKERMDTLVVVRIDDVRAINKRLRPLEAAIDADEITKP